MSEITSTEEPTTGVVVQYRTPSTEACGNDFWYEGDNQLYYESVEDAIAKSMTIQEWRAGGDYGLTVVRVLDRTTGVITYISPFVEPSEV